MNMFTEKGSKFSYESPKLESLEIALEQGFAASLENFTYDEETYE